jgi:hypothetical protein
MDHTKITILIKVKTILILQLTRNSLFSEIVLYLTIFSLLFLTETHNKSQNKTNHKYLEKNFILFTLFAIFRKNYLLKKEPTIGIYS